MLYSDEDMDALHILPLAVVPLQTRALQGANLVKNSRLRSVVELFAGKQTGSGQIEIGDLRLQFEALKDKHHPDLTLLKELGRLRSYDVYSLRITLREQRIPLEKQDALRLSSTKEAELANFMRSFTRSLVNETFAPTPVSEADEGGLEPVAIDDDDGTRDLSKVINPSDPDVVFANLANLAKRLELRLNDLPKFLENFADLYLSIAYYENCYDGVAVDFDEFSVLVSRLIRSNKAYQRDSELLQKCDRIEYAMTSAKTFIHEQLMLFDVQTRAFWNEISASRFREIEKMAKANHLRLGGILCGMTVKMNAWRDQFPSLDRVNSARLAEFVRSELGEGIGDIYDTA